MYFSSPAKQLTFSNFMALPLASYSLWNQPLYWLPALFSICFCLIALGEVILIVWRHFRPDPDWE